MPAARYTSIVLGLVACASAPLLVLAADRTPLRVVELFTSHGCSSCPQADELLGKLIERDASLIALEYHVDYWNRLVHGNDGNWVDPFSGAQWTLRQREYDIAGLDGRGGVYTPQMIVNGRYAAVGSDARRVNGALSDAETADVDVTIESSGDALRVEVTTVEGEPAAMGVDVVLVRYLDRASTEVTAGENRHRTMVNHNIVRSVESLGTLEPGTQRFEIVAPSEGEGCAVLVQDRGLSPILGAAQCP